MQCFHSVICSFAFDNFDLADNFTIVIEDFAVLVGGLAGTLFEIGVFRQLANDLTLVVENFALLIDFPSPEDGHVGLDSFLGFLDGFINLDLLGLVRSLAWNDFRSANDFSFFVENLSLLVQLLSGEIFNISLDDLADGRAVLAQNFAIFADLKTFQNANIWECLRCRLLCLSDGLLCIFGFLLSFLSHLFSLLRRDSSTTDCVTILVQDLTVLANGLSHEVLGVAFGDFPPNFAIRTQDIATFTDLKTLEDGQINGEFVFDIFDCIFSCVFHTIDSVFSILGYSIFGALDGFASFILNTVDGCASFVFRAFNDFASFVLSAFNGFASFILRAFNGFAGFVLGTLHGVASLLRYSTFDTILSVLGCCFRIFGAVLGGFLNAINAFACGFFSILNALLSSLFGVIDAFLRCGLCVLGAVFRGIFSVARSTLRRTTHITIFGFFGGISGSVLGTASLTCGFVSETFGTSSKASGLALGASSRSFRLVLCTACSLFRFILCAACGLFRLACDLFGIRQIGIRYVIFDGLLRAGHGIIIIVVIDRLRLCFLEILGRGALVFRAGLITRLAYFALGRVRLVTFFCGIVVLHADFIARFFRLALDISFCVFHFAFCVLDFAFCVPHFVFCVVHFLFRFVDLTFDLAFGVLSLIFGLIGLSLYIFYRLGSLRRILRGLLRHIIRVFRSRG